MPFLKNQIIRKLFFFFSSPVPFLILPLLLSLLHKDFEGNLGEVGEVGEDLFIHYMIIYIYK
jgi:hypothetical protein